MVQSDAPHEDARLVEDVLLDPIRQAIRSFVGSVEASSKEMTVAAERFALDSAQLIRTASTARRHQRQRAMHQDRAVADLAKSASAVTQAASQAAASARVAAGAASPSAQGENMSEVETLAATSRRLQRLEEDISILTGLLREVYDRVGNSTPPPPAPAATPPAAKGPRRFRMRPSTSRLSSRASEGPPPEQRYYAS